MTPIIPTSPEIEAYRQQFPGLANKVYFNFGGQGTMSRSALDKIIQSYEYIQNNGPFCLSVNQWIDEKIALLRSHLAAELNATADSIAITENVTTGCNIALWGIEWQKGDRILITDCEHPGVVATVNEISRRFQVEVDICPMMATLNDGDPVKVISKCLQAKTRLVVVSHVLWNTGQILPIAEIADICHNYSSNLQVLVDAAQSVGALPLNLPQSGVDFYAFTGHKWLCGPAGVGGFYVSQNALKTIAPTFIGIRGIYKDKKGVPIGWKEDGRRFEISTSAFPLFSGLIEAIAVRNSWGNSEECYQQICRLSKYLWEELGSIEQINCLKKSPPENGLVFFTAENIANNKLVLALEKEGFMLRTLADPDCIRACVHYFTLPAEIDRLIATIKKLV
ncbi:MAG: aminotransferase class V-fold PLP-dependent enzyme [Prochloraceae cyanobacterium]